MKTHLLKILDGVGVADRASAVTMALEMGLIELPRLPADLAPASSRPGPGFQPGWCYDRGMASAASGAA